MLSISSTFLVLRPWVKLSCPCWPPTALCTLLCQFPQLCAWAPDSMSREELPNFEEQSCRLVGEEKDIQEEGSQPGL